MTSGAPPLAGRVVVVTGAAGGIGRAVVEGCLAAGAAVVAVERARKDSGPVKRSGHTGPERYFADTTDEVSMSGLADFVDHEFGGAWGVVASVGQRPIPKPIVDTSVADWENCISTNLTSTFITFRAFVPGFVRRQEGSLVAISSLVARRGSAGQSAYSAAKGGVLTLVRSLAAELGPSNVRVNAISPGLTLTERISNLMKEQASQHATTVAEVEASHVRGSVLGRAVTPAEIADACTFLLGPHAAAVTGEDLNLSTGAVMY